MDFGNKESPTGERLSMGGSKEELQWEWPGRKQMCHLFLVYLTLRRLILISDLLFVHLKKIEITE